MQVFFFFLTFRLSSQNSHACEIYANFPLYHMLCVQILYLHMQKSEKGERESLGTRPLHC